jgi:CHAT domain-containing protein/Flp pilus assembly protein TadD
MQTGIAILRQRPNFHTVALLGLFALIPVLALADTTPAAGVSTPVGQTQEASAADPSALQKSAVAAMKAKDWPQALTLWERYLVQKSDDAYGHRGLGWSLREMGRSDDAIAAYRKSAELAPKDFSSWNGLCWTQILLNIPLDARLACEKAVALDKTNYAALVNLGHTFLLAGDAKAAEHWYRETLLNISSESDLKDGPLADFDLFIGKGWQVDASQKAKAWFVQEGADWLTRIDPVVRLLAEINAAEENKDYARAIALHERRLPMLMALYGQNHLRIADAQKALTQTCNQLADQLYARGSYAEALALYRRVLADYEGSENPEEPLVAGSLNDIARALADLAQYREAEPLQLRALAIRERLFGPEHNATVVSLIQLIGLNMKMSRYAEAVPLYERLLRNMEKALGPEHKDMVDFHDTLGNLYRNLGRYSEALLQYERALNICEKTLGTEHRDTANSLHKVAKLLNGLGQHAKALPLFERALRIREKELGPEHADTGICLNSLAGAQRAMGQYAQAEPLYLRVLSIAEKSQGPEHPFTGTSLNNLAGLYKTMGKYALAEPLFVRALAISEKADGAEHPSTGISLNNLANLYESMGQYARAEPLFVRALAISEKADGAEHPSTGISLNNLANLYESMGQYARAEPLFVRALAISEKADGAEHPSTGISLNNLANLYESMGQYARAEPLYLRAMAISEKTEGAEHRSTGIRLKNLAELYSAMGQYARAEPLYLRALTISERANGAEHPSTGRSLSGLAGLYRSKGQYTRAEPLYVRALAISEKAEGAEHPSTGPSLNNLAELYRDMGKYARAEPLYLRALAISEKAEGAEHPTTGIRLNNLAGLYETMGQYARAEPLLVRTLTIFEKVYGAEHSSTGTSLNNLAELYRDMGQYARAEPLYVRALAISEKTKGAEHPSTGIYLNNLALLYGAMGQDVRAEPLLVRTLAIFEKTYGAEHPSTGVCVSNLAGLYKSMGQYARAEPLYLRAWRIASLAGDPALSWTVQGNLRSFYAESKPELAIWYGKQAVNTLQSVRADNTALNKEMQKSFLEKNETTYKSLTDLLFAQGRLMEGQQVLAMLKEAEYFDFIQRSSTTDPRKTQAGYTGQEKPWAERYDKISGQLAAMSKERESLVKKAKNDAAGLNGDEQTRKDKLDADLAVARQAYDDFMVDLKREFSQSVSTERQQEFGEKNLASLRALQGTLRDLGHGSVTLHYLMTDKRLWILLTTPMIQLKREAAISEADLNRQIGQYREAIARRDPKVKQLGKALYDLLIAPVANDLKQADAQTLMLSLDGALRYLPMAALHDGEQFLAQRYRLALYTSAAKDKLKDKPQATWTLAAYGLTQKHENFDALPSVKGELEGILQGMTGNIKLDNAFTAKSFKTGLESEPPVVHPASHFVFKPGNETDSFLLLGDGKKLSLKEIKDGYEFINLDLLTLSACETAVGGGKDDNGREVEGFGAMAQNQGAKGVIATLWPVADQSTGQFMQLFYGFRQKNPGMTKAEAMQKAQQAFIEGKVGPALAEVSRGVTRTDGAKTVAAVTTTDHPYYWAPFILMGNWL